MLKHRLSSKKALSILKHCIMKHTGASNCDLFIYDGTYMIVNVELEYEDNKGHFTALIIKHKDPAGSDYLCLSKKLSWSALLRRIEKLASIGYDF